MNYWTLLVIAFNLLFIRSIYFSWWNITRGPKLLIISFDGFRYDYPQLYNTPNLNKLIENGVTVPEGIIPCFPTETIPNYFSISTGLYPESHGMIDNYMHDPKYNESIFGLDFDMKFWNSIEPIWITCRKYGIKTGLISWPGLLIAMDGITSNYIKGNEKDHGISIDKMIDWLANKNIGFGALYIEIPDTVAHSFGPISKQVSDSVTRADNLTGYLMKKLRLSGLIDITNIIIVGDHGMSNVTLKPENVLILKKYLKSRDYEKLPHWGALVAILPAKNKERLIYKKLKDVNPHIKVYLKKDIPERFHYKNNVRVAPIVIIPEEHYFVVNSLSQFTDKTPGIHGYDNQDVSMRPFFVATGPRFKKNLTLTPFENVNIYPLMCFLLNIKPRSNNGSLDMFKSVLIEESPDTSSITRSTRSNSKLSICIPVSILILILVNFYY